MWNILDVSLNRGEKKQLYYSPNGLETHKVPITLICGAKEGKTLGLIAGTHSGEYPAIPATSQFAKNINPQEVTGQIVIIHCLNSRGFWEKSMDAVPDDNMNLNSSFPGNKKGTPGEKIIDFVATKIFPELDFLLDMHSGSKVEKLVPCLFYCSIAEDAVVEATKKAALALNYKYLIIGTSNRSLFGYAALSGVPNLLVERGCFGECKQSDIQAYIKDIIQLMKHLGMISGECEDTITGEFYTNTTYLSSDVNGVWFPKVEAGQQIKKGEILGCVEDIFGNPIKEFYAEYDSVVFYLYCDLPIDKGTFLVAYGSKN